MDYDDDTFYAQDLEKLIIKDKKYHSKRKKIFLCIFIPLIICILIGVVILILISIKRGGKIFCKYNTTKDKETIRLININSDIEFSLIIDDNTYDKSDSYTFENAGLHSVTFHFKNKLDSLKGFFKGIINLIEVDFSNLITEYIKSMEDLFNSCTNLIKVNFDNATPNLENTKNMFFDCTSLININLNFDTLKVSQMDFMFYYCQELTYLDISNFQLENLVNSQSMFHGCGKLKEILFNDKTRTKNLKIVNSMFKNCQSLEYINTKIFVTKKNNKIKQRF